MKQFILYKFFYNDYCVYLGRTMQPITNRIRGHFFSKPMHRKINIDLVSRIEVAQCQSEADMYLYEIYYINQLKPALNCDDKAHDNLNISLPELEFVEFEPKLMQKWKEQLSEQEAEKEHTRQRLVEWQERYHEARRSLRGDDWYDWVDNNPKPIQ